MTIVLIQYPESAEIRSNMYKIEKDCSVKEAQKLYDAMQTQLASEAFAFVKYPLVQPKEITEPMEMIVEFWCDDLKAIQAFVDYLNR